MTPDDLKDAFERESERVEWKQSDRDTGDIFQAVAALANDLSSRT